MRSTCPEHPFAIDHASPAAGSTSPPPAGSASAGDVGGGEGGVHGHGERSSRVERLINVEVVPPALAVVADDLGGPLK